MVEWKSIQLVDDQSDVNNVLIYPTPTLTLTGEYGDLHGRMT